MAKYIHLPNSTICSKHCFVWIVHSGAYVTKKFHVKIHVSWQRFPNLASATSQAGATLENPCWLTWNLTLILLLIRGLGMQFRQLLFMMTSWNRIHCRFIGHLCGEFTGHRWIPLKRPVTRNFDVFFDFNEVATYRVFHCLSWWLRQMETFSALLPICGEFTGHRWIPHTRPVTRNFDVFFDFNEVAINHAWVHLESPVN